VKHFRSKARNHEALAIDRRADILDLLMGAQPKENETIGSAVVVHVSGPLEHRACGYGDSYEDIKARFTAALAESPEAVILRIDSPGGVVAGLNEFVESLIAAKNEAGVHVIAYADELVASAAYALACAADEIITPASGIVGSIGVIALLCDQVEADRKAGLNFVTITSGARKDDGHPHTTISDDAIAAESKRVDVLAQQFFDLVRNARGFDPQPLEAGVFTGEEAVAVGVADYVMGWDEVVAQFALAEVAQVVSPSLGHQPTERSVVKESSPMPKLKALIAAKKAALKSAKGAARAALQNEIASLQFALASLASSGPSAAYKKTTKTETKEEKTDDEEDDDKEASAEDEPDGDEKESAEEDDAEAGAEDDDSDKDAKMADEDEEDEEPKKDAVAGKKAAVAAKAERADQLAARVASLEAEKRARAKAESIALALGARRITKAQAKMLSGKKSGFVREYLSMHTKALYAVDGEEELPDGKNLDRPFGIKKIGEQQMAMFQKASAASGIPIEKLIENYQNADPALLNGKG
jgi:ClpP class serine protease